jgi:hypothetical protein
VKKEFLLIQAGAQSIAPQGVTQTACHQKGARGFRKTLIVSDIGARRLLNIKQEALEVLPFRMVDVH